MSRPLSAEDAAALAQHFAKRPSKYRNVKTVVDGEVFDSKKEARRYQELQLLQKAGEIHDLRRQVRYPLVVNGVLIATYVADAVYGVKFHGETVEDTKSDATRKLAPYRMKKKLMLALHHKQIFET